MHEGAGKCVLYYGQLRHSPQMRLRRTPKKERGSAERASPCFCLFYYIVALIFNLGFDLFERRLFIMFYRNGFAL